MFDQIPQEYRNKRQNKAFSKRQKSNSASVVDSSGIAEMEDEIASKVMWF